MRNTKKLFKDIYSREFKVSKSGVINQTQRNALKNEILNTVAIDLSKDLGIDVLRVDKGLAFNIENENEGAIPLTFDFVIKNINYDVESENQAYLLDKKIKAENKEKRKKERETKFKNDQAKREFEKN